MYNVHVICSIKRQMEIRLITFKFAQSEYHCARKRNTVCELKRNTCHILNSRKHRTPVTETVNKQHNKGE